MTGVRELPPITARPSPTIGQCPFAVGPYDGQFGGLPAGSAPFPPPCSIRPSVRRLPWSRRLSGPAPHHVIQRWAWLCHQDCRFPRCAGTRSDILAGKARASAQFAHWRGVCLDSVAQRSGGGYRANRVASPDSMSALNRTSANGVSIRSIRTFWSLAMSSRRPCSKPT